jgi:ketosteroid isomerase-like protein
MGTTVTEHPNTTALLEAFAALAQGDTGPTAALLTEDFVMVNHDNGAGDRHLVEGRDAFLDFLASWAAFLEGTWTQEPMGIFGDDDHLVMLVRETGRRGDAVFDNRAVYVIEVHDGRWTRLDTYDRDREANAAFWARVGLSGPPS